LFADTGKSKEKELAEYGKTIHGKEIDVKKENVTDVAMKEIKAKVAYNHRLKGKQ